MNENCGLLVPPRDAQALATALAKALDRHWDAEDVAAHGGRSWDTVAAELLSILEELVMARPTRAGSR
jgi:glycosyltransferase involved in cell wall biosynthesis